MSEATEASESTPSVEATPAAAILERVAKLRERAQSDPAGAQDEAWTWIEALSGRANRDREGANVELQELFRSGRPPAEIRGQTEGMMVAPTINPVADKAIKAITDAYMPWHGKSFDPARGRGINVLADSARWPAKLLWPLYSTGEASEGREAFEFKTYVERGELDPEVEVLVIDYESVPSNPSLLIKDIRDELVEIVPGANLGKMLVKLPAIGYVHALYFALKSEI